MALCAFQARVTALQRVLGRRMLLYREGRRFPPLYLVARGALASIRALKELAVMGVLVAIGALGERDLFLEVAIGVALGTLDFRMLSFERIFRLRVVEALIHVLQRYLFPASRCMAGRAGLRETA